MPTDYFTEDEYRQVTGDRTIPYKAESDDIARGQDEVITRVEDWARSSWRVRTGRTEQKLCTLSQFLTERIPIAAVGDIKFAGTVEDASNFAVVASQGIIRWGDWSVPGLPPLMDSQILVEVTYSFGWNYDTEDIPWEIKTPCIQATESRLRGEEAKGKIPRNATNYRTERTEFTLGRRGATRPFPWDSRASDDLRASWDNHRPRQFIGTGA